MARKPYSKNKFRQKRHPRAYYWTFYCLATDVDCIPLRRYCEKYFLTPAQVATLLRKGELRAVSFKKKLWVEDKPTEPFRQPCKM